MFQALENVDLDYKSQFYALLKGFEYLTEKNAKKFKRYLSLIINEESLPNHVVPSPLFLKLQKLYAQNYNDYINGICKEFVAPFLLFWVSVVPSREQKNFQNNQALLKFILDEVYKALITLCAEEIPLFISEDRKQMEKVGQRYADIDHRLTNNISFAENVAELENLKWLYEIFKKHKMHDLEKFFSFEARFRWRLNEIWYQELRAYYWKRKKHVTIKCFDAFVDKEQTKALSECLGFLKVIEIKFSFTHCFSVSRDVTYRKKELIIHFPGFAPNGEKKETRVPIENKNITMLDCLKMIFTEAVNLTPSCKVFDFSEFTPLTGPVEECNQKCAPLYDFINLSPITRLRPYSSFYLLSKQFLFEKLAESKNLEIFDCRKNFFCFEDDFNLSQVQKFWQGFYTFLNQNKKKRLILGYDVFNEKSFKEFCKVTCEVNMEFILHVNLENVSAFSTFFMQLDNFCSISLLIEEEGFEKAKLENLLPHFNASNIDFVYYFDGMQTSFPHIFLNLEKIVEQNILCKNLHMDEERQETEEEQDMEGAPMKKRQKSESIGKLRHISKKQENCPGLTNQIARMIAKQSSLFSLVEPNKINRCTDKGEKVQTVEVPENLFELIQTQNSIGMRNAITLI